MITDTRTGRWAREVAHIRSRAAKLQKQGRWEDGVAALLEESLSTCESLLQELAGMEMTLARLQSERESEAAGRQHLLQQVPLACLTTDASGQIVDANESAGALLNTSPKHVAGRLLLHFAEDREAFAGVLRRVRSEGGRLGARIRVRPRERAPRELDVVIVPELPENTSSTWLWFLVPSTMGTPATMPGRGASRKDRQGLNARTGEMA